MTTPGGHQPASGPYRDTTYAGAEANINTMSARTDVNAAAEAQSPDVALWSKLLGGNPTQDTLNQDLARATDQTNAYVSQVMGQAHTDGLGTQAGPPVGGVNYQSIPHAQLYQMTHTDIDSVGLYQKGDSWNNIGNEYADTANAILNSVSASESSWQGSAADGMRASLRQLAAHTGGTGQATQAVGAQMYSQSEAVDRVRNSVPPPSNFDAATALRTALHTGGIMGLIETQNVYQQQLQVDQAHTAAADATDAYEQSLGTATASTPAFAPPPRNAAPAKGSAPSVGGRVGQAGPVGSVGSGGVTPGIRAGRPGGLTGTVTPAANLAAPTGSPTAAMPNPPTTTTSGAGTTIGSSAPNNPGTPADPNAPADGGLMPIVDPGVGGLTGLGGDQARAGSRSGAGLDYGPGRGSNGSWSNVGNRLGSGGGTGGGTGGGQPGPGARSGVGGGPAAEETAMSGRAASAAASAEKATMAPGMLGAGRGKDEDDKEHKTPPQLADGEQLTKLVTDDMDPVVPPTIGDDAES